MRLEKVVKCKGKDILAVKWVKEDGRPHRCIYTPDDEEKFERDVGKPEADRHRGRIRWRRNRT